MEKNSIFYYRQGGAIYKCHVIEVFMYEETPQIFYKYYGKHKQWWHYNNMSVDLFNMLLNAHVTGETLKEVKR